MTGEEQKGKTGKTGTKKRRKGLGRKILLFLLAVLVIGGGGLFAYARLQQEYTVTYQEYAAVTGSISNSLSFSGALQVINSASYTASSASTVRAVNAAAGQTVRKGETLMRLSSGQSVQAEFDGRVNQLFVQAGDKVAAGSELIQVVDFSHMKVSIRVDEYDISDVHVGDACRVTTTATENIFDSVIADINYVSSSTGAVAYYTATAYVDAVDGVYPGMQVTVTVPQEEAENVVVLREDALSFSKDNRAFVYMQNAAGEMTETYVTTGVSNGNYVEIKEGLQAGDLVYVQTETEAENGIASLFTSLFRQQRVNGTGGTRNNTTNTTRNNSNFGGGNTWQSAPGGNGGGR